MFSVFKHNLQKKYYFTNMIFYPNHQNNIMIFLFINHHYSIKFFIKKLIKFSYIRKQLTANFQFSVIIFRV